MIKILCELSDSHKYTENCFLSFQLFHLFPMTKNNVPTFPDDSFSVSGWFKASTAGVGTRNGIIGLIRSGGGEYFTVYIHATGILRLETFDVLKFVVLHPNSKPCPM